MNNHGQKRSEPVIPMDKVDIVAALSGMEQDSSLRTVPVVAQDDLGSVTVTTFQEKHLSYLQGHPKVNPKVYLANLKTMIKIR